MLRTRRRNKIPRPEEDRTLKQWGGLNAETRGGIEPDGEDFSLDIPFYRTSRLARTYGHPVPERDDEVSKHLATLEIASAGNNEG